MKLIHPKVYFKKLISSVNSNQQNILILKSNQRFQEYFVTMKHHTILTVLHYVRSNNIDFIRLSHK